MRTFPQKRKGADWWSPEMIMLMIAVALMLIVLVFAKNQEIILEKLR